MSSPSSPSSTSSQSLSPLIDISQDFLTLDDVRDAQVVYRSLEILPAPSDVPTWHAAESYSEFHQEDKNDEHSYCAPSWKRAGSLSVEVLKSPTDVFHFVLDLLKEDDRQQHYHIESEYQIFAIFAPTAVSLVEFEIAISGTSYGSTVDLHRISGDALQFRQIFRDWESRLCLSTCNPSSLHSFQEETLDCFLSNIHPDAILPLLHMISSNSQQLVTEASGLLAGLCNSTAVLKLSSEMCAQICSALVHALATKDPHTCFFASFGLMRLHEAGSVDESCLKSAVPLLSELAEHDDQMKRTRVVASDLVSICA